MLGKKTLAAVSLLAASLFFLSTVSASADEVPDLKMENFKELSLVVLGDSYSAGNGAGDYLYDPEEGSGAKEEKAYRSRNGWGYHYAGWLLGQGVDARLKVIAHSGNTIGDVLAEQVENIPSDTDLVMLTIGGNDGGFNEVVRTCFAIPDRHPVDCKKAVDAFRALAKNEGPGGLKARTKNVLSAISEKLNELKRYGAGIVLIGYPNLMLDKEYTLYGCRGRYTCYEWVTY